jgi:hypothetical protein
MILYCLRQEVCISKRRLAEDAESISDKIHKQIIPESLDMLEEKNGEIFIYKDSNNCRLA